MIRPIVLPVSGILLLCLWLGANAGESAPAYAEVGKACPDHLFRDVQHCRAGSLAIHDMRGKWLVINCFNTYTAAGEKYSACFKLIDRLHRKYAKRVSWLVVGYTGGQYRGGDERGVSDGSTAKENLSDIFEQNELHVPIAYDSGFFHAFDIGACPYVIVVDPKGIVRATTFPLAEDALRAFLHGQEPSVKKAYRTHEPGSDFLRWSQSVFPTVGEPMPDHQFNDVAALAGSSIRVSDLRGKWTVLDCWNAECGGCINALPKTDSILRALSDRVNVLLIGYTGSQYNRREPPDERKIKALYGRVRAAAGLCLPIAYDSVFFHRNDICACPYIIVLDPKGVVRCITNELNKDDLLQLMEGGDPHLPQTYRWHEEGGPLRKRFRIDPVANVE